MQNLFTRRNIIAAQLVLLALFLMIKMGPAMFIVIVALGIGQWVFYSMDHKRKQGSAPTWCFFKVLGKLKSKTTGEQEPAASE